MNLKISLGKNLNYDEDYVVDLVKDQINTVVISGQTGSGKSTFQHSITKELMNNNTAEEIGFVFIDHKLIEFGEYDDSEYLIEPILKDWNDAGRYFKGLIRDIKSRVNEKQNKRTIVHIDECDTTWSHPGLMEELWEAISDNPNCKTHVTFVSSTISKDVFSRRLLDKTGLKGFFTQVRGLDEDSQLNYDLRSTQIFGTVVDTTNEPWVRVFQMNGNAEYIITRGIARG